MSISNEHYTHQGNQTNGHESLLTNSFDDQIKLVEESVATLRGDNSKAKRKSKTSNDYASLHETANHQKSHGKNVYTHRSRIYRFESNSKEHVPMVPPVNVDMDLEPPKDETDARASMLMSWYMAGYKTGYYEAMKRCSL